MRTATICSSNSMAALHGVEVVADYYILIKDITNTSLKHFEHDRDIDFARVWHAGSIAWITFVSRYNVLANAGQFLASGCMPMGVKGGTAGHIEVRHKHYDLGSMQNYTMLGAMWELPPTSAVLEGVGERGNNEQYAVNISRRLGYDLSDVLIALERATTQAAASLSQTTPESHILGIHAHQAFVVMERFVLGLYQCERGPRKHVGGVGSLDATMEYLRLIKTSYELMIGSDINGVSRIANKIYDNVCKMLSRGSCEDLAFIADRSTYVLWLGLLSEYWSYSPLLIVTSGVAGQGAAEPSFDR